MVVSAPPIKHIVRYIMLYFHIEDAQDGYIYHWLFYMVAPLRRIIEGKPNGYRPSGFQQNADRQPATYEPPYHIIIPSIKELEDHQKETLSFLPEFVLCSKDDVKPDDVVINVHGEEAHAADYIFLRERLSPGLDCVEGPLHKRFYIRRSRSHLCKGNAGVRRRQVHNEDELCAALASIGIESLFMEDLTIRQKVQLFREADLVVAPSTGGLCFTIFMKPGSTVIEINVPHPHQFNTAYEHTCKTFGVNHHHFRDTQQVDSGDNMIVPVDAVLRVCCQVGACCPI